MLLDQLFGAPLPKVLKIVRKNGKMKTVWKPIKLSDPYKKDTDPLFPISKERK